MSNYLLIFHEIDFLKISIVILRIMGTEELGLRRVQLNQGGGK